MGKTEKNELLSETVSERRKYKVKTTEEAKKITLAFLKPILLDIKSLSLGLPEIHDRYDNWNVPVLDNSTVIGSVSIDAFSGKINEELSTKLSLFKKRAVTVNNKQTGKTVKEKFKFIVSNLSNTIVEGKAENALRNIPEQSVDLIFTSPPYYNARKEYSEYESYEEYLDTMRDIIQQCKRVLINGKFFVINSSHVLVPRASRNESSTRIPVPFDLHQIFMDEGFEFVDDIIWQKPEGAGWASGRGRRFSADRNPMQYKAVPVTEYVMVYRKKPAPLIDNFIRKNPNQDIVLKSKIDDDYEKTNVWYISPARDKRHPAIFPNELAEKVIKYYSFVNDVVLDPFGGIGTTAKSAAKLGRRFYSIESSTQYVSATRSDLEINQNLLNNNFDYTYLNLTNLPDVEPKKSLRHTIKELLANGVTSEELIQRLNKD
ncbi:site-specific DNA-methyltransferase [Leuconostoc mesenteroides]|uniref:site-specific DNA-methyltransferase n=1 Tax=Leuconostoc mesenteroides TaxID=1245 RepID=UPI00123BE037|nr:site-specific DNA-methyltransferase [Leuconostoc mesenteroides]KAA8369304.1 site-specific DNA-methyltransferase [Leuconostoc mesenteroides]MDV7740367.1 site-specific DNA-methyltransferase [Leuconostoc mesenteroides]